MSQPKATNPKRRPQPRPPVKLVSNTAVAVLADEHESRIARWARTLGFSSPETVHALIVADVAGSPSPRMSDDARLEVTLEAERVITRLETQLLRQPETMWVESYRTDLGDVLSDPAADR